MSNLIRRRPIDTAIEKQIITAMIVSTEFLKRFQAIHKPELFQMDLSRIISGWCYVYFETYEQAPNEIIQDIYKVKKELLSDEDTEAISIFLSALSDAHDQENNFNVNYILDKAEKYIQHRNLSELVSNISGSLADNDALAAEAAIANYSKIQKGVLDATDIFDSSDWIDSMFETEDKDYLFKLKGNLGKLIPYFYRETLVAFAGPEKRGKCLTGDSLILQSDGNLKSIEEIVKEKDFTQVISLNTDTNKFTTSKIVDHIASGEKKVYRLITRTGRTIKASGNHPFLTTVGWKKLEELNLGDHIASSKSVDLKTIESWPKHEIILLAYLLAEGGLTQDTVTFSKIDRKASDVFKDAVFKMGDSVTSKKGFHYIVSKKTQCRTKVRAWLKQLGIGKCKSKEKEIPKELFSLNKKEISLFLSVLFDCDGSIEKTGTISYSSASKKMICQIQHLLTRYSIVSCIREKIVNSISYWELLISSRENSLIFLNEIGFFVEKYKRCSPIKKLLKAKKSDKAYLDSIPYSYVSTILKDKMETYNITNHSSDCPVKGRLRDSYISSLRLKGNISRKKAIEMAQLLDDSKISSVMDSDVVWDRIESIDYMGIEQTYDICLENNFNFIANDIIVHNSWWLMDLAITAVMTGLNVAHFNFEMREEALHKRLSMNLTTKPSKKKYKTRLVPMFDCRSNQDDTCTKRCRTSSVGLYDEKGKKPTFDETPDDYEVCKECSGESDYSFATWYREETKEVITKKDVVDQIKKLRLFTRGKTIKMQTRPSATYTVADIENQLDIWENEGFLADVVVVDYADLLLPKAGIRDYRQGLDDIWSSLKRLAQKRRICVLTATQATKEAYEKRMKQGGLAEDKRKAAHTERIIALNQIKGDKEAGIMRLNILFEREDESQSWKEAIVLHQLAWGKPHLTSLILNRSDG